MIAYDSDLEFVARTMREVAEEELGEAMMQRERIFRELGRKRLGIKCIRWCYSASASIPGLNHPCVILSIRKKRDE